MESRDSPGTCSDAQSTPNASPFREPRLCLIRHGKPQINEDAHPSLWPLSQSGREATASLADKLKGFTFRKISSSPEPKALETAEVLGKKLGLEVEIDKDLSEHSRHGTTFLPLEEFEEKIKDLFEKKGELVFGEETANAALDRFKRALGRQEAAAREGDVLVVTHGTILSIYVSWKVGVEAFEFWKNLSTPIGVVIKGKEIDIIRV